MKRIFQVLLVVAVLLSVVSFTNVYSTGACLAATSQLDCPD
jgi:hypothetical protein